MDNFLLHCPIAYELWTMVFSLFGIHWGMPHWVVGVCATLLNVVHLEGTEC